MPLYQNRQFPKQPKYVNLTSKEISSLKDKLFYFNKLTGEIFENYNDYSFKNSLYKLPIWECELTGKQHLTYEQALNGEKEIQIQILKRLNVELRKEILDIINNKTYLGVKEKSILQEKVSAQFNSTFFVGELVLFRPKDKTFYIPGYVLECLTKNKDDNEAENIKYYKIKVMGGNENSIFELRSNRMKHYGSLGEIKKMRLKLLVIKWIRKLSKTSEIYRALKEIEQRDIPTQDDLRVEIPYKKNFNKILINNNGKRNLESGEEIQKLISENNPESKIEEAFEFILVHQIILDDNKNKKAKNQTINKILKEYQTQIDSCKNDKIKMKFRSELINRMNNVQINNNNDNSIENSFVDLTIEEAPIKEIKEIKYPIEDLEINFKLISKPRPTFTPINVSKETDFSHIFMIWSFVETFSKLLDIKNLPLMEIEESLKLSTNPQVTSITTRRTKHTAVNDGIIKFPFEKMIIKLLEFMILDSEKENFINFWIPEGINDINNPNNKLKLNDIGDWRKGEVDKLEGRWACVLTGAILELYCKETLPFGEEFINKVASIKKQNLTELPIKGNNEVIDLEKKASSNSLSSLTSDDDLINLEKRQLIMEPLIKNYILNLDVKYKVQLLIFLIESTLGTQSFRQYYEENFEVITQLRRDKLEFQKKVKMFSEEIQKQEEIVDNKEKEYNHLYDSENDSSCKSSDNLKKNSRHEAKSLKILFKKESDKLGKLNFELDKAEKRISQIDDKIIKRQTQLRYLPIGQDRFYNRYYYLNSNEFNPKEYPTSNEPIIIVERTFDDYTLKNMVHKDKLFAYRNKIEGKVSSWACLVGKENINKLVEWATPLGLKEKELKRNFELKIMDL